MKEKTIKNSMPARKNRVAIIGCDEISATSVYSLLTGDYIEDLVLVGKDGAKLRRELTSLPRGLPPMNQLSVRCGNYQDAASADIVVIAAGAPAKADGLPVDSLPRRAAVVRDIASKLKRRLFHGILLVIANPVDILARAAQEESGLPANRVIGSGASLEMTRAETMVSEKLGIQIDSTAEGLNGEGESETASWCAARLGETPMIDFCTPDCPDFENMLAAVRRRRAAEITRGKARAFFPAGSCVNRICETILLDERSILPVSVMTTGEYGIAGVYLSLPCVVGRRGIERIVELSLSDDEKRGLTEAAASLKETYESLIGSEKFAAARAN
jgi:L-lactate dehydrogenase